MHVYVFAGRGSVIGVADGEWKVMSVQFLGGAIELESGNVLVTAGGQRTEGVPAYIIEVDPSANNDVAWQLEYPTSVIYRARRRSSIAGETLSP